MTTMKSRLHWTVFGMSFSVDSAWLWAGDRV